MFTPTYMLSQVFIIFDYACLIISYQLKSRKKILVLNMIAAIFTALSCFLLNGFSAVGISIISIIRNSFFLLADGKDSKKTDTIIFILTILATIVVGIFTYEGILSLMPILATILYTISIYQKNTKVFKLLGALVSISWITYDVYIFSVFAIVIESIVLISSLVGYFREKAHF